MLERRASIPMAEKELYDQWVCKSLLKIIKESRYTTIHCYLPMGSEINIYPLIQKMLDEQITVITPKTLSNRRLQHLILSSLEQLEKGKFGTRFPSQSKEFTGQYDAIIVPGLAFDKSFNRLGYGGGYYDHFLAKHPGSRKVGIFYPFQEVAQVPIELYDVPLNEIIVKRDYSKV